MKDYYKQNTKKKLFLKLDNVFGFIPWELGKVIQKVNA